MATVITANEDWINAIIAENTRDLICVNDSDGRFVFVSKTVEKITGYKKSEIIGQFIFDFIHPADMENAKKLKNEMIKSNGNIQRSYMFRFKSKYNGYVCLHSSSSTFVHDGHVYIQSSTIDVTEALLIKKSLRTKEKEIMAIIHSLTDQIVEVDVEGNIINQWSPTKGGKMHLVLDNHLSTWTFLSTEDRSALAEKVRVAIVNERSVNHVFLIECEDVQAWYQATINPIEGMSHASLLLRNITAEKKHEKELVETIEKSNYLSALKTRLVTIASHEFRTPLAAISSSLDLMKLYFAKNPPVQNFRAETHMHTMHQSIDRLTKLINDVLTIGQIEEKGIRIQCEAVDLDTLVCEFISRKKLSFFHGREITFQRFGFSRKLQLDPGLIEHALENMLLNALNFSPENTAIDIVITYHPQSTLIKITDKGIGIPEKDIPMLFNMFYRATNTIGYPGNGLGLVVVKHILDLHQAHISVKNIPGSGAQFTIHFNQ
jgi:PAS domain S-box-containing protein